MKAVARLYNYVYVGGKCYCPNQKTVETEG